MDTNKGLALWMPLINDLHNQGYATVTTTMYNNGTPTFNASGKLASTAYNSPGNTTHPIVAGISHGTDATYTCWSKTNISGNMMFGLQCTASTYMNLFCNDVYTLNVGDSNDNPFKDVNGNTISVKTDGVWHHFAIVFKGSENAKLYIDGNYVGTAITYRNPTHTSSQVIAIGKWNYNSTSYIWNGGLQDFRVYTVALDTNQIKHIAQGLVLHYPMNEPLSGTDNLTRIEPYWYTYWDNSGSASWDWDSSLRWSGVRSFKISRTDSGDSCIGFCTYANSTSRTFVASVYVYITGTVNGNAVYLRGHSSNGDLIHFKYNGSDNPSTWPTNKWIRIVTDPLTVSESFWGCYYLDNANTSVTFSAWQIEEGSYVTPYVYGTRSNNTTVHDISGFNNNGTVTASTAPSWSNDTVRYDGSYLFDGVDNSIWFGNLKTIVPYGTFTFNVWFKKDSLGSKSWETFIGGPSGFELSSKYNSTPAIAPYTWCGGSSPTGETLTYDLGKWYMLTFVRTLDDATFYITDDSGTRSKTGAAASIPGGNYYFGSWSSTSYQNYKGYMSDIRIYATALSQEDIQELYKMKQ